MKKILILLTVLLVLGASCKDFLTVNEFNPNSASAVPANLLLTAAVNTTARIVTNPDNYSFIYFWYGCMSVSSGYSQPADLTQYRLINSRYQDNWSNSYTNLQNYDYIEQNSQTEKLQPYKAIAMIMKVYLYQNLVDSYGNIPYTEALKTSEGNLKPAYDDQKAIYEDLVLKLDEAMALITSAPADADEVGSYDIVYGGDMSMWLKFANTLKLRLLINQSDMTGREAYITAALATTPTTADSYIGAGEGAMSNPGYLQSADKMNPFWENFYKQDGSQQSDGLGYYVAGQDACDFMTTGLDPRKLRLFQASTTGGTTIQGNYFGAVVLEPTASKLGPGMLKSYNQDAPLLTDVESLLLQSEAALRGLIPGNAQALYESAVTQSIIYMGGADGTADAAVTYLAQIRNLINWDASSNKLAAIITQKWIALNGLTPQPIWVDCRRTGFPDFLHFSEDPARENDTPPVRLDYPETEISRNNDNVVAQGTIDVFESKIFWQNR